MIHRDVKPSNILMTPDGTPILADFGLARMASERAAGKGLTQVGSFMGTPEYVSPEQAMDATKSDIRADIYSLGCTLYFLLTGRPPFVEDTAVKFVVPSFFTALRLKPQYRRQTTNAVKRVLSRTRPAASDFR